MPQDEDVTDLGEIVVTGVRNATNDSVSWLRDFFGFDSGSFRFSDLGTGASTHVVVSGGGGAYAVPLDENGRPMIGVQIGVDIDLTDGSVGPDVGPGVGLDSPEPGWYVDGLTAGYWANVPYTTGGLGMYPVPGGEYGENYWGYPPGSGLSPFPDLH